MVLRSGIRDPGSGKNLFRILDPGVKKHPILDPGSGSATLPKWNLLTDPLSLYGRRLCRTVTACCTGTTCLNVRALRILAAADILTLFSEKNQKPNSAHKCPITSIQVCIESQKLSEFSCITFGSLNRGRPPFQPLFLKITNFWSWGGYYGRGGGARLDKRHSPCVAYDTQ